MASLLFVISGCGGGGGSSSGGGGVVLQKTVKSVGASTGTTVVASDKNSITLSGATSGIQPGSVIVSMDGNGLIRKVNSVSTSGGNLVCQTTQGLMTDVVTNGSLQAQKQFSASDLSGLVTTGPHVKTFKPLTGGGLTISFSNKALDPDSEVLISGNLTLNMSANFSADIAFPGRLKTVRFVPTIGLSGKLTASVGDPSGNTIAGTYTLPLGPEVPIGSPIPLGPFFVVPVGQLNLVAKVSVVGQVSWEPNFNVSCGAGLEWDSSTNSVKPITTSSSKFDLLPSPNISFGGTAEIALQPSISLLIDDVVGPSVTASVPDIKGSLSFQISPSPATATASVVGSLNADAALKADIFGFSVDYSLPNVLSYQLFKWSHTWTDSTVTPGALVGEWTGTLEDAGTSGFTVGSTEDDVFGSDGSASVNGDDSTYTYSNGSFSYTSGDLQAYTVSWTDTTDMVWTNVNDGRIYDFARDPSSPKARKRKLTVPKGHSSASRSKK